MNPPAADVEAQVDTLIRALDGMGALLRTPVNAVIMGLLPMLVTPAQRTQLQAAVLQLQHTLETLEISLHQGHPKEG